MPAINVFEDNLIAFSQSIGWNEQSLTPAQIKTILHYKALLQKWGKTYNLTANLSDEALFVHFADSLATARLLSSKMIHMKHWGNHWVNVGDIGSGAGFPSIISAILNAHAHFTLFEIDVNKSSFLQQVIVECGLRHVVLKKDFSKSSQKFDVITSKAFLKPHAFLQHLPSLLKPSGYGIFLATADQLDAFYSNDLANSMLISRYLYLINSTKNPLRFLMHIQ